MLSAQLLGYWLRQSSLNVTYVKTRVSDLNCDRSNAGLGPDLAEVFAVHHLKGPTSHHYIWGLLQQGVSHETGNCSLWTRVDTATVADRKHGRPLKRKQRSQIVASLVQARPLALRSTVRHEKRWRAAP